VNWYPTGVETNDCVIDGAGGADTTPTSATVVLGAVSKSDVNPVGLTACAWTVTVSPVLSTKKVIGDVVPSVIKVGVELP
jgi:hypothetical protein